MFVARRDVYMGCVPNSLLSSGGILGGINSAYVPQQSLLVLGPAWQWEVGVRHEHSQLVLFPLFQFNHCGGDEEWGCSSCPHPRFHC